MYRLIALLLLSSVGALAQTSPGVEYWYPGTYLSPNPGGGGLYIGTTSGSQNGALGLQYLTLGSGGAVEWNADTFLTRQASGSLYLGTSFGSYTGGAFTTTNMTALNMYTTGLTLSGVTGSTYQCLQASLTGVVSGTGAPCGSGGGGTTANALTFNNSGSGAASGTTFNGGTAQTISYNTLGAQQALTLTTTGSSGAATLSGGTLNIPTYTGGGGGGGVPSVNSITSAVTIAGTGGTTVNTAGSTITVSSTSSGGVSGANFMFVGDSITCGLYSSSGCPNNGPGSGTPVVTGSTGYNVVTAGTASSGSTTMTVASATGIINGELVVGPGIALGTTETISGTTVTLSLPTIASLSSTSVSFGMMDYPAQAMRLPALTGNSNQGINAGVAGWTSAQLLAAYTSIVHPYAPSVTGKPGYIFVMIGTNDLLQGVPYATTVANLTSYWQTAHNDGWTVIAFTIPNGPWGANSWQQWITLNQFIRQSGTVWNRLVDEAVVLSNDYDNTLWNTDHIHPINGGYSILANLANTAIASPGSVLPSEQILPWSSGYGDIFYPVITGGLVTTGFYDAAFGILAMQQATTDYQDSAFGASALAVANGSHDDTAIGHYTQGNVSTGYNISSLGSAACNGVTTGNNDLCLGASADVSSGASAGRVQLGNGTNATDNTMQFQSYNFLTSAGAATFTTIGHSTIYSASGTGVPTCTTGNKGLQAVVSDAITPTFLGTYASGGAVTAPVMCNGSAWVTY